jgi:2-alkenal reductase
MKNLRFNPLLLLSTLLITSAIACQSSLLQPASEVDTDAIVREVVATVEAGMATPAVAPVEVIQTQVSAIEPDLQSTLVELYRRANPSVVHIFVFSQAFDAPLGSGSGFVYDEVGRIVTNNHVVAEGDRFEVVFVDGTRRSAELVGTDVDSDLAVIRVDSLPQGVTPLSLADSASLEVGQFVIAIGNPFQETGSMSIGIISGLGRTLDSQRTVEGGGRYSLPQVIQTDAAINPGNSGGPLLNLAGEVIGVNSTILSRSGTNSGVGFAIPVNAVKRIAPALIAEGVYDYPYIGISMASSLALELQQELGLTSSNGVYVTNVVPGSPAAEAGLMGNIGPGGDFIVAVDGQPVKDSSELVSYLVFETVVGQTIELSVLRDSEEIEIPLTLGARP